jgi:hypothetical protein
MHLPLSAYEYDKWNKIRTQRIGLGDVTWYCWLNHSWKHASLTCPYESSIKIKASMENYVNVTDRGKPKYLAENRTQGHFSPP